MKILKLTLLLAILCFATSQVIGIDFGTQFWKASLISPGKNLVIVQNSRSGRKSYNGIAFMDGIRYFQYDAFQKRQKKPKASYFYLNKLMESLDRETPLEGHNYQNGTYHFTEGEDTFTLEQLTGMILKNIKKYSSLQAGSDIKDAVITVPAHWGFKARMALVNAASLADLSVLGLINQNSAAAVQFAITRNDTDPINIGFFNLGSNVLQITFVQFFGTFDPVKQKYIQSMKVLSHVSVPELGGLQVDKVLAEYIADQFKLKHNLDVRTNQKSWVKLLVKCADLKQDLSANKEAHIFIEGFMDGKDLNMNVKRSILQTANIFSEINKKAQEALDKAGLSKEDVQSIEVIGGASRIPLIGKNLKDFFDPVEVGSHINGDQSMAFGAALRAANLSIAFRVKQLHFYDGYPEQVKVILTNNEAGVLSESILFNKDSEHGLRKQIAVETIDADIKVSVYYGQDLVHQYLISNVSQWKDRYNQSQLNFTESPKLILIFSAHSVNFAELKEAYVNITLNTSTTKEIYELVVQNVTIEVKNTKNDSNQTTAQSDDSGKTVENQNEEQKQQKTGDDSKSEGQNTQSNAQSSNEKQVKAKQEKQSKKKTRERTRSVKKTVDDFKIQNKKNFAKIHHQFSKYRRYSKDEVQKLKEVIHRYQKHENYIKQRAKVRNDFESTLYRLKEDFENPSIKTFSTETQIQQLKESVTQELTWFEQNGWTAEKHDFQIHFRTLQRVLNPIVNRSNEYKDRQLTFNRTMESLSLVYSKTVELIQSQPWVQEKAQAHLLKINNTVQQIHTKVKRQVQRNLNQNVIFYNHQMIDQAEDLRDQYYLIKMLPRPKIPKKVEVETPKEPTTDENLDLDGDKPKETTQQQTKNGQTEENIRDSQEKEPVNEDL